MSYYNTLIRETEKQRSKARAQARAEKQRALFAEDIDADFFAFDQSEVLDIREQHARSFERDIYNDERAQGIFGVSAANPNDYL